MSNRLDCPREAKVTDSLKQMSNRMRLVKNIDSIHFCRIYFLQIMPPGPAPRANDDMHYTGVWFQKVRQNGKMKVYEETEYECLFDS